MSEPLLDVIGIGNAIVDVIASGDDGFLARHGMVKGSMMLIDEPKAHALYAEMGSAVISSGGSAANTVAGVSSLGGATAFIGKVHDDPLGQAFRHDITAAGTIFTTPPTSDGPSTARCLIVVTSDSQRTMNTFLGACANLTEDDIDETLVRRAKVTYLEGYLYDEPAAQRAFHKAARAAHDAGRKVALSLSDAFCVERHRDQFLSLIREHVDLLFCNEAELVSLFLTNLDAAIDFVSADVELAAVTRGADGSVVVGKDGTLSVPAHPTAQLIDTTGAGDLYAAGFLFAFTRDAPLRQCAEIGGIAAAEVISHFGARPQTPLYILIDGVLAGAH